MARKHTNYVSTRLCAQEIAEQSAVAYWTAARADEPDHIGYDHVGYHHMRIVEELKKLADYLGFDLVARDAPAEQAAE